MRIKKEDRAKLVQAAAEGWQKGLTAQQISDELGITRNTVIGFTRDRELFPRRGEVRQKVVVREIPTPENTVVEDPPIFPDPPEGALEIPWVDLEKDQCQFSLEGFWADASNKFPCCGLPVVGGQKLGKRFCEFHQKVSEK